MKQHQLLIILAPVAALFFGSCESQIATGGGGTARFAQAPTDRPGLGTKWGETRESRVGFASFRRADSRERRIPENPAPHGYDDR